MRPYGIVGLGLLWLRRVFRFFLGRILYVEEEVCICDTDGISHIIVADEYRDFRNPLVAQLGLVLRKEVAKTGAIWGSCRWR